MTRAPLQRWCLANVASCSGTLHASAPDLQSADRLSKGLSCVQVTVPTQASLTAPQTEPGTFCSAHAEDEQLPHTNPH